MTACGSRAPGCAVALLLGLLALGGAVDYVLWARGGPENTLTAVTRLLIAVFPITAWCLLGAALLGFFVFFLWVASEGSDRAVLGLYLLTLTAGGLAVHLFLWG